MAMAAPMGPPVLPGFSLRVQLFSSNAYGAGDRPIRCFRVVTTPEVTISEFCDEASRIHDINYGEPIAIKKCQDDQGFDVTQTEIVGSLFTSTATIRVIQASQAVNIRDSVPPDSALRYDPALSSAYKKRRNRRSSVQANGSLSPASGSNKRRKLSDIDPDTPIASCERDLGGSQEGRNATTIPDSQQSSGRLGFRRGEIPDTVSPPPHPALLHPVHNEKRPTDQLRYKPATASRTGAPKSAAQGSPSRPTAPSAAPAKSKSASYHIERATEWGTSVSTDATSPLSADQQLPPHNRPILPNKTRLSGPANAAKTNGKPSPKERNIYDVDEIDSDSAGSSAIIVKTKASLKERRSPMNGGSPLGQANKFNTPPTRRSRSGDQASAPELPLTPRSKQREEKQQRQLEVADKSRDAAAEAAERRIGEASGQKKKKQEAEEARKAERAKAAEAVRLRKEELDRLAAEKRAAVAATAARLEKERLEKMEHDRKAEEKRLAEQKLTEQTKLKKEKLEQERKARVEKLEQERKARIVKQSQEEERKRREEAKAATDAEAERLRKEEVERNRFAEATAAEEMRKSKQKAQAETQTLKRKLSSASVESSRSGSRLGPSPVPKPQSSTPFIPNGRKSALKSSQATLASSPMPRQSPSDASVSSSQAGPMYDGQRRVSFNLEATPIQLQIKGRRSSILPADVLPKQPRTPILPPEKQSHTPILPPASIFAKDRTTTPVLPPKKVTSSITPPASITPKVTVKSASPIPVPLSKNSTAPRSSATQVTPKAAQTAPEPDDAEDSSADESGSDIEESGRLNPANILNSAIRPNTLSPKPASKPELAPKKNIDEEQKEDVEMESGPSTPPETRSPVVFNHNPPSLKPVPTLELSKSANEVEDEGEAESISESSSSDEESNGSSEDQEDDEDDDEDEDGNVEEEMDEGESVQVPKSSIELPRAAPNPQSSVRAGKPKQRTSQLSPGLSDKESTTQDAIDYQLTSSIYEVHTSSPSRASRPENKAKKPSVAHSLQRPRFKIGASLTDLNAAKVVAEQGRAAAQSVANGHRSMKSIGSGESGSESESESGDDTDSESEEEAASRAFDAQLSQAQSIPLPTSDEDSSSDSDSEEEYRETMRNELITDLARMARKTAAVADNAPSLNKPEGGKGKSRIAGRDIVKAEKKKRENKYLTGYTFSQVK